MAKAQTGKCRKMLKEITFVRRLLSDKLSTKDNLATCEIIFFKSLCVKLLTWTHYYTYVDMKLKKVYNIYSLTMRFCGCLDYNFALVRFLLRSFKGFYTPRYQFGSLYVSNNMVKRCFLGNLICLYLGDMERT
jgi:hypothetical protein